MNSFRNTLLASAVAIGMAFPVLARDTGKVFVSSEKDNAIYVLDGGTLEVVKRIGTAARPRHIQFDPARQRIFVACGDGDAIDIIDVAKLELVDRITGIDDPELFDFSADGNTLYISLEDDARLGILDLATYFGSRETLPDLTVAEPSDEPLSDEEDEEEEEEAEDEEGEEEEDDVAGLTTIEVGAEPEGILANPDGSTVYVSSEVANLVHVVDLASGGIRANILVGQRPRRFALTPDGSELWITNELAASVSIIDVAGNTVAATLELEPPTGLRSEDVTPVGITMTADGRTGHGGHGPGQPHRLRRCRLAGCDRHGAGGQPGLERDAEPRRQPALCRQRAERRHDHHRHGEPPPPAFGAGRAGAAYRADR